MRNALAQDIGQLPINTAARVAAPATINQALDVVLERTRWGDDELAQSRLSLGDTQRQLLSALDGQRTLTEAVPTRADADQLAGDAARLVAFGLVRQVRHELPRRFMVAAINMKVRAPSTAVSPTNALKDAAARPTESPVATARRFVLAIAGVMAFAFAAGVWLKG